MRRFIRDYNPKFVSKSQEKKEFRKPVDFAQWVQERNNYILEKNENDFFLMRDQIIVIDVERVASLKDDSIQFNMMVGH